MNVRYLVVLSGIMFLLTLQLHAQALADLELSDSTRKRLAFELFEIYIADQAIRHEKIWLHPNFEQEAWSAPLQSIDSINYDRFFDMVRRYGWPSKKRLEPYYIDHACFQAPGMVILLHNPKRIAKEQDIYQLLKHEALVCRLDKQWLADALDKYYVVYEHRSLYGTQMKNWKRCTLGGVSIHDRQLSDSLRRDIGLPPLDESEFVTPHAVER